MEGSKSGGNKKTVLKNVECSNSVVDEIVIDILESSVEQEVQNVIMSTERSRPSCLLRAAAKSEQEVNIELETAAEPIANNSGDDSLEECVRVHECNMHNFQEQSGSSLPVPNVVFSACSVINPELFDGLETISRPPSHNAPPAYAPERCPVTSPAVATINLPDATIIQTLQRREPLMGPPPSYSKSLLDRRINPCASIQFVAPIPPPSYDGTDNELRHHNYSGFTLGLGNTWQSQPQPAYCPACETVIITRIEFRVSRTAHIIALVLLLMLCWPFCLLPYFINYFNYTFHYCALCHSYLGARRPFHRS
ncbi:uncharacterized protein LOC124369501 [Homalodisca vitripennis]|uniref:uncharacterized protein LOC124369501 n=1 Tax=Homalodisca vitripennis TaxID=197043 RepID=UPI001EEA586B|nr:uncharacterized protein LOC124369501 [Homalodisca vitripennis]